MSVFVRPKRSLWDEVWDEYDARCAARGLPRARVAARPAPAPAPAPPPAPARAAPVSPRRRWLRRPALALTALLGLYLASPIASAVQFASAVQRADPASLAERVDWTQLRPELEARLGEIATTRLQGRPPAFLGELKASLADRLASPEGLARALAHHLPPEGGTGLGQTLRQARPLSPGLWQVSLASPAAPQQAVRLTLRLADPLSLHWAVVAVELPGPLGPWP